MKQNTSNLFVRLILTGTAMGVYSYISNILTANEPIALGDAAIHQFNSNGAASALVTMHSNAQLFGSAHTIEWVALIAILIAIWSKPLLHFVKTFVVLAAVVVLGTAMIGPNPALAYYSTNANDSKERVDVQSNETAFLVNLLSGATDGQTKMDSKTFKTLNAAATQRIEITHEQVVNPGWTNVPNYWVSTVRLLIVNRTMVSRDWVSSATRGTSTKDESFHFESAESHDGSTGIVISAFIREEDASNFLYWYGPKPINKNDLQERYASVVYAESLAEVVDQNVRRKVQEVLAREFGKLKTEAVIANKAAVMETVKKEVVEEFAKQGITITTLGYAEGITWGNPKIQQAMDNVFIAGKEAQIAKAQGETLAIQMELANIEMRHAQARALEILAQRWGGVVPALPNWIAIPDSFGGTAAALFKSFAGTPTPTGK